MVGGVCGEMGRGGGGVGALEGEGAGGVGGRRRCRLNTVPARRPDEGEEVGRVGVGEEVVAPAAPWVAGGSPLGSSYGDGDGEQAAVLADEGPSAQEPDAQRHEVASPLFSNLGILQAERVRRTLGGSSLPRVFIHEPSSDTRSSDIWMGLKVMRII